MFQYRFQPKGTLSKSSNCNTWANTVGETEQAAADHIARLVGSTCPVPGAYKAGSAPARKIGDGLYAMPTGAVIEVRNTSVS